MSGNDSKLVYSTDKAVPRKEAPKPAQPASGIKPSEQKVRVSLDRKGRGGKSVTLITGLAMPERDKEALLKQLKSGLGTGGTLTDAGFEIQGDHRDAVMTMLEKRGYRPKRAGG